MYCVLGLSLLLYNRISIIFCVVLNLAIFHAVPMKTGKVYAIKDFTNNCTGKLTNYQANSEFALTIIFNGFYPICFWNVPITFPQICIVPVLHALFKMPYKIFNIHILSSLFLFFSSL